MSLYMINGQWGPYTGAPGLDLHMLGEKYRAECYAKAEATGEDFCFVTESGFVDWLVENQILTTVATEQLDFEISTSGEHAYVPKHWPLCPVCEQGRGDDEMQSGTVRYSLNRVQFCRVCTACGHKWEIRDEPYHDGQPMLDDDGRCVDSGCVPYAISQVSGIDFDTVLEACRHAGWREGVGLAEDRAIDVAHGLGLRLSHGLMRGAGKALTLRRFMDTADLNATYLVSTGGHWLAVVNGCNRDQADTSMRTLVRAYWSVAKID